MAKNNIKMSILGISAILIPLTALSTEQITNQEAGSSQVQMPKEAWLTQVKNVVPEPICKGFLDDPSISARFKEINLTYEQCLKEIPPLTDKCIAEYSDKMPAQINQNTAAEWGRKIGECIGNEFAQKFLAKAQDEAQSQQPEKSAPDSQ